MHGGSSGEVWSFRGSTHCGSAGRETPSRQNSPWPEPCGISLEVCHPSVHTPLIIWVHCSVTMMEGRAERWGQKGGRNSKSQHWQELGQYLPEIWSWEMLMLSSTWPWVPWKPEGIKLLAEDQLPHVPMALENWFFQQILFEIQANKTQGPSSRSPLGKGLTENDFLRTRNKPGRNAICSSLVLPKMGNGCSPDLLIRLLKWY